MIERYLTEQRIEFAFKVNPVCGLLGPRQCGKTTLARQFAQHSTELVHFFDLEDERDVAKLQDPILFLEPLKGIIIMDEVQHLPQLFRSLRVLVDQATQKRFLVLGSASGDLLRQSSETLAGRISMLEMSPLNLMEGVQSTILHERGGFPKSYLAESDAISFAWRGAYIKMFLERDIPSYGISLSPQMMRRFWTMLAHMHGGIFNASEIGNSLGINYKTAQHYLDILEGTFMVRRLQPWFANIQKRQVKSPKIYIRDSGIFHVLLGIENSNILMHHPKLGASWEGFAIEQIISAHQIVSDHCFYWRTQNGAEIDLLLDHNGRQHAFEFKYTNRPTMTKSIYSALEDLSLDKIVIIIPGKDSYPLHPKVHVYGLDAYINYLSTVKFEI